jgi:hypothetical protein
VKATSYDLTLGDGHMVYDSQKGKWVLVWIGIGPAPSGNPEFNRSVEARLTIEPYGGALVQLRERIDTRSCIVEQRTPVCGRFDLRLGLVVRGLISQQATQVEPGYDGYLFCFLFNQSDRPVILPLRDEADRPTRIATIEFSYASCEAQCSDALRDGLLQEGLYGGTPFCDEHGIADVRKFAISENQVPAHAGLTALNAKLDQMRNASDATRQALEIKIDAAKTDAVKDATSAVQRQFETIRQVRVAILTIVAAIALALIFNYGIGTKLRDLAVGYQKLEDTRQILKQEEQRLRDAIAEDRKTVEALRAEAAQIRKGNGPQAPPPAANHPTRSQGR